MVTVRCPSCARALEVEDAYRDWTVRCPHCAHEFVPEAGATESRPEERRAPPRRRRRPDYDRDEYDRYDDRDDDYDDEPSGAVRERALALVAGPALWLEILSWLGALAAVGVCALCVVLALEMQNGNRAANAGDEVALMVIGACTAVFGVPYSVAMGIGARKMRTLQSRGWALAAAILGITGFVLFGVCGAVHAGIGVWALVALENPVVRAAFGVGPRRRRRAWD